MRKSTSNSGQARSGSNYGQDANFADVSLTQADKDAFLSWMQDAQKDLESWIGGLIDDSYRLSIKFDYNNNCYSAAVTQQDNKHLNSGLIIMSRSDDPIEAILMSCYKVFVLFEGQRLPTRDETNNWG